MAQVTITGGYIKVVGKPIVEVSSNPDPKLIIKTSYTKTHKPSGKCCGK